MSTSIAPLATSKLKNLLLIICGNEHMLENLSIPSERQSVSVFSVELSRSLASEIHRGKCVHEVCSYNFRRHKTYQEFVS